MSTISYKLDLIIALVDATNGKSVAENDVIFYRDGSVLQPHKRGEGTYVLFNCGREDFDLVANVRGFHQCRTQVRYETMNENQPLAIVFLIPDARAMPNIEICEVSGRIPHLTDMEAIGLSKPRCCINEYSARRMEMSVFQMEGSRYLEDVHYGILHAQEDTYEHIEVEKNIDIKKVKLKYPLEEPFSVNAPVCRVIFANIEKDGSYRIAMRKQSPDTPAIVKYRKNGVWYYLKCDFNELTHEMLLKAKKYEKKDDREEVEQT